MLSRLQTVVRVGARAQGGRSLSSAAAVPSGEPSVKPASPNFSSGPCAKRPGWSPAVYAKAPVGRSHRSAVGKARLKEAIEKTRGDGGLPHRRRARE